MGIEIINRIEKLNSDKLFLGLEGKGDTMYQYIYRTASGVYWDQERRGFKSTPIKESGAIKRFTQICAAVESEFGVSLQLGKSVSWLGIEPSEQSEIAKA